MRAVKLADEAKHAVLRIHNDRFLSLLIHPDDICAAAINANSAAVTQVVVNTFNSHNEHSMKYELYLKFPIMSLDF